MADITMCRGADCPKKESCYQYTAPMSEYWQSMFSKAPWDSKQNNCPYYWSNNGKPAGKQIPTTHSV